MEYANILKLNEEELPIVAKLLGYQGNADRIWRELLNDFNLKLIAYTKGSKGSVLITPYELSSVEAPGITVIDSVGAGDAFTAMLAVGFLEKRDLSTIHAAAARLASYVCTRNGATPIPPPELLRFE